MVDFSIFVDNSKGYPLFIVNGEVCRFNDYDYDDPDHSRQEAMRACGDLLDEDGPFTHDAHSLAFVVPNLHSNTFSWFMKQVPDYLVGDELLAASVELGQNILKLSVGGEAF